ncbi:MAG: type II toxin-antitoxin system RelE/ParE family toxin [Beijerinckiaceae bacterium]|nr:type II toxin-antitoxin system RelE/ParE family toxin [Beijerinckiaceae bacterium]
MKWRLAPQAERDLGAIGDYIALDSPRAADELVERFRRRWRLLTTQPYSGPARPDIGPAIRHLVIGSYLTLYRVHADHIEILRVLHGRRDLGETGQSRSD